MNPLELIQRKKQEKQTKHWLRRLHHDLQKAYGYIPIEEFKGTPLSVWYGLREEIQKDYEEEKKAWEKAKRRR